MTQNPRRPEMDAAALLAALEEIADPVAFMRKRADAEGLLINGAMAVMLANDPGYLKGIARSAIQAAKGEAA